MNNDFVEIPETEFNRLLIRTDGGARPNPGHGAAAAVLYTHDGLTEIGNKCVYLGNDISNNIAEHAAILLALQLAERVNSKEITINSDSKLAVDHLNDEWPIQNSELGKYVERIKTIESYFDKVNYIWVPRAFVKPAHLLVAQRLSNKPEIIKKNTPLRRLANDVAKFLYEEGIKYKIEQGFVTTDNTLFALMPFFKVLENEKEMYPSIDEVSWFRIKTKAKTKRTILVWRPYGAKSTPMSISLVPRSLKGSCENINNKAPLMIMPFEKAELSDPVGLVAFNGSPIRLIKGGPFKEITDIIETWKIEELIGNDS